MASSSNNTSPSSRWSPLTSFPKQLLTQSGLLALDTADDEVEIETKPYIELRSLTSITSTNNSNGNSSSRKWHDRDMDLNMTLTTHRLVFQTPSSSSFKSSNFLHLSNITSHSVTGGEWLSNKSYKILVETSTHGSFYFIFRTQYAKSDRDKFYGHLEKALKRRQWEEASRLHSSKATASSAGVGVAAIVERNRLRHERNAELANQAFGNASSESQSRATRKERETDVENLMREAKELTNVIHKYVQTLEKNSRNESKDDDDKANDDQELTSMLSHMGMITAMPSKQKSSSAYYDTLARQISDFLKQNKSFSIQKGGNGIMTLTDVYCLFNRARGANMISPEDLITAVEQMEKIGLGMKVREFDNGSGVSVLQETRFDDSVMVQKLREYIDRTKEGRNAVGLTAMEAGRILKISPLLAKEQLLSAEQNGLLCRDVTLEGTRFFCNNFVEGGFS